MHKFKWENFIELYKKVLHMLFNVKIRIKLVFHKKVQKFNLINNYFKLKEVNLMKQ